jgi:hypothetical protein
MGKVRFAFVALGVRGIFAIIVALLVVALDVPAPPVRADEVLVVPSVRQTFWPPEYTGQTYDRGTFDCVPSSVAMVLQALQETGRLDAKVPTDYPSVRRAFRRQAPNAHAGIVPGLATKVVPALTDDAVSASLVRSSPESWRALLDGELIAQRPVIAVIDDWSLLTARWTPGGLVHAIVVTGLEDGDVFYNDPWDGKSYWMTEGGFATAWGHGANAWIAITVRPTT